MRALGQEIIPGKPLFLPGLDPERTALAQNRRASGRGTAPPQPAVR
jgi:hypothetical protein